MPPYSLNVVPAPGKTSRRFYSKKVSPKVPTGSYDIAQVTYELNVLGTRGPRRMHCIMHTIPTSAMDVGGTVPGQPELLPRSLEDSFRSVSFTKSLDHSVEFSSSRFSEIGRSHEVDEDAKSRPLVLKNKPPRWHEQLQCWCLNFRGRVTVASVFSHDWKDPPNNICTFYQKGICAYGSRCRYDHVKASQTQSTAASASTNGLQPQVMNLVLDPATGSTNELSLGANIVSSSGPLVTPSRPAWKQASENCDFLEDGFIIESRNVPPAERPICSFAAAGNCPRGETCPHIHGDSCPTCGKHCLHPFRPDEREDHIKTCERKQKHLEALKHSQEIECSVCLERVLSKAVAAERKFGLLSECDHPFCISCIRNWRSSSATSGMDMNNTVRACPICRRLSYFVIPSVIWYATKKEKQEIVDNYKARLKSIDCRHFDFGNGSCPFGTSCFYKHAYHDGRLEEVVLRHLGAEDGNTIIAKDIRLSDFLRNLHLR